MKSNPTFWRIMLLAAQITALVGIIIMVSRCVNWLVFAQLLGFKANAPLFEGSFFRHHALKTLPVTFAVTVMVLFGALWRVGSVKPKS